MEEGVGGPLGGIPYQVDGSPWVLEVEVLPLVGMVEACGQGVGRHRWDDRVLGIWSHPLVVGILTEAWSHLVEAGIFAEAWSHPVEAGIWAELLCHPVDAGIQTETHCYQVHLSQPPW